MAIFEPNFPLKGASEGNAGTICPNLKPWSTKSPLKVLRSNLFDKPEAINGMMRYSVFLDPDFWRWTYHFMTNRSEDKVLKQLKGLSDLFYLGFDRLDTVVNEITQGNPERVEFSI